MSHRQKVEYLDKHRSDISVIRQAALLGISRASLYYQPKINQAEIEVMGCIDEIYTDYPFYGPRRVKNELKDRHHISICRDQVRRLMKLMGMEAIYPKKNTSQSQPGHQKYPYLLRGLKITKPDQVWGTDITYVKLEQGYAFLTAIIDWYSRYVIAWSLSASLTVDFADVRTIMGDAGPAIMGTGTAQGDNRAVEAARKAISSPLLEISIDGARGILFAVAGGNDLTLSEINEAAKIITDSADPQAKIIFGAFQDDTINKGSIKITVIAAGFSNPGPNISSSPKVKRFYGKTTDTRKYAGTRTKTF